MLNSNPLISIVSPVYLAEKIVDKLVSEIQIVMNLLGVTYEIILVDDRSTDNSWEVMKALKKEHQCVVPVKFFQYR